MKNNQIKINPMSNISKLKKTALIVGILFTQISFAQENYQPGVVIKNNGDTLRGFIDYRNWASNPDEINFKLNTNGHPSIFKPIDLQEFRVKDEIYVCGIVQTECSPVKAEKLNNNPQPTIKVDTTFLQTLIGGEKSLYYYKNKYEVKNFYIGQGKEFELLMYKRYFKLVKGKRIVNQVNKYVGQLNIYLNDCPTIGPKLTNVSYKQNSLMKLFNNYYDCTSSELSFRKEKDKVKADIGVLAGTSMTKIDFASAGRFYEYLTNADYSLSTNFSGGTYLELILPRNQGKWSINNEILFSEYKVKGKVEDIENANSYRITSSEIGYSYLKMNNMLRYKYPVGKTYLFANAGISNGIVLDETNNIKVETKFYTTEDITEGRAIEETRQYEQGYLLGTGLKYKALALEFRFEKGYGISKYQGLESSANRYFLLLGYKLNKGKK